MWVILTRELGGVPTPPTLRPISRAGTAPGKGLPARDARMRALAGAVPAWQAQAGAGGCGERRRR